MVGNKKGCILRHSAKMHWGTTVCCWDRAWNTVA